MKTIQPEISARFNLEKYDVDVAYLLPDTDKKTSSGVRIYEQEPGILTGKATTFLNNGMDLLAAAKLYQYNRKADKGDSLYNAKLNFDDYMSVYGDLGIPVNEKFKQRVGLEHEASFGRTGKRWTISGASQFQINPEFDATLLLSLTPVTADRKYKGGAKASVDDIPMTYALQFGGNF